MRAGLRVAVVIPTKDRPQLVRKCLQALTLQSLPPHEVIVVDDGSVETLSGSLGDLAERLPLEVVRMPSSRGPAAARNVGWRASSSELIAFTDDDCRPGPEWLSRLVAASHPGTIVVGRTTPDPQDGEIVSVFDRSFEAHGLTWGYSSCNVLYPREVLVELAGFDETFRSPWAEDTDLALRARAHGAAGLYAPDAVVYHAIHRRGVWPTVRERWRSGQVVRLVKRNPDNREEIYREGRFFWRRSHFQLLGLYAGLSLMPISPVFALVGGPWLEEALWRLSQDVYRGREPQPRRQRVIDLCGLVLLDSVEVLSCAVWSFRERTLLL